jgi:asparagine synthase (glutamine-hydrolysing)
MCGIAAIFAYDNSAPDVDERELRSIRDYMTARGPDASGEWYGLDRRIGMAHRRLSIIDLSNKGAQPMANADGTYVITFNGEIYNYRELRHELEATGRRFHSFSDTEVLLRLFEEQGEAMLTKLRGMYAFAIWDGAKRSLFLARDPFGIKPLYYSDNGKTFRAASQVKALLAGRQVDTAPDAAGRVGFFLWGHVPDPYTFYRGIHALPAGTCLWIGEYGPGKPKAFCSISDLLVQAERSAVASKRSPLAAQSLLRASLLDTVQHHLIADVPVGFFLSSGIDSTTLTALAAQVGGTLRTVTLGFEEFRGTDDDEVPLAEEVARSYGTRHETFWLTRDDFEQVVEKFLDAMDQPSTDGVNSFFVSRAAAQAGLKVAVSGIGGDELFGGYPSFQQIPRMLRMLKPFRALSPINRALRIISAPAIRRFTSPKYAGLLEYGGSLSGAYLLRRGMFMPWELTSVLDPDLVREGWRELQTLDRLEATVGAIKTTHLKLSAIEMCWYMRHQLLRDTDWASMYHSLEIRVPLVDIGLLRNLAPLFAAPTRPSKRELAGTPQRKIPNRVLNRRKTGFSVPVRDWILKSKGHAALETQPQAANRGLRGWARMIYSHFSGN